jgi:DNA-binding response OmpR family regulator
MEQHRRVLIVDDNAMNVDVLRRILREEYELDSAADGEECLSKLPSFKPHMVLLDVMMPGMDGCETCKRIKTTPEGDAVQVILISGKGTAADRVHGYEALADDYVVKPFDHDELLAKVRAHFRLMSRKEKSIQQEEPEIAAGFRGLLGQVGVDIDEQIKMIETIQQELTDSGTESHDGLLHAMARLADMKKATRGQLISIQQRLQQGEIERSDSEDCVNPPALRSAPM